MASIHGLLKVLFNQNYREERKINLYKHRETQRLLKLPMGQEGETQLLKNTLKFYDGNSFISLKREIFDRGIYKFDCKNDSPVIVDGGANIGLSVLYFKTLYPQSRIIAFEPDPVIFEILKYNIASAGLKDVTLHNEALWDENSNLLFYQEGKESGRILIDSKKSIIVKSRRLGDFLNQRVDFLKLDIEGAELKVLSDIKEQLQVVDKVFVEYHSYVNQSQELDVLLKILKTSGFRVYIENSGLKSQTPFVSINKYQDMDMLVNIFAYR